MVFQLAEYLAAFPLVTWDVARHVDLAHAVKPAIPCQSNRRARQIIPQSSFRTQAIALDSFLTYDAGTAQCGKRSERQFVVSKEEVMAGVSIDTLARRASGRISRKTSLKVLGGAVTVTVAKAGAESAEGRKKGSKGSKGPKSPKGVEQCKAQQAQCLSFVENVLCARQPAIAEARLGSAATEDCIAFRSPCCDSFATCALADGLRCLRRRPTTDPIK